MKARALQDFTDDTGELFSKGEHVDGDEQVVLRLAQKKIVEIIYDDKPGRSDVSDGVDGSGNGETDRSNRGRGKSGKGKRNG